MHGKTTENVNLLPLCALYAYLPKNSETKVNIILSIAYMQAYYNLESESIPWFDQSCMFSFIALFYKLHFIINTFKTHAVNNKKEKVAIEKGDK